MTKKKGAPEDIPGNARGSAVLQAEYYYKVGLSVADIERARDHQGDDRPEVVELRIKCDVADVEGVLVIIKGTHEHKEVVAFHRDDDVVNALRGVGNRLRNGSLKWREEKPYGHTED